MSYAEMLHSDAKRFMKNHVRPSLLAISELHLLREIMELNF